MSWSTGIVRARYMITPLRAGERTVAIIATGHLCTPPLERAATVSVVSHRPLLVASERPTR
jgi:hypothetical protein